MLYGLAVLVLTLVSTRKYDSISTRSRSPHTVTVRAFDPARAYACPRLRLTCPLPCVRAPGAAADAPSEWEFVVRDAPHLWASFVEHSLFDCSGARRRVEASAYCGSARAADGPTRMGSTLGDLVADELHEARGASARGASERVASFSPVVRHAAPFDALRTAKEATMSGQVSGSGAGLERAAAQGYIPGAQRTNATALSTYLSDLAGITAVDGQRPAKAVERS